MSTLHLDGQARPFTEPALAFYVRSQRRVIAHCERLLAAEGLAPDHRARLLNLRDAVQDELQRVILADAA